jgi:diacylglycerol kinase
MGFLKSFSNALRGIGTVWREERNFRIQIFAGVSVILLSFILSLSIIEKSILVLLVIIILSLEMLNSILERFIDVLKPRVHSYVKDVKDIAAGAVLVSSLGALTVGIIIFYPHILSFIALFYENVR